MLYKNNMSYKKRKLMTIHIFGLQKNQNIYDTINFHIVQYKDFISNSKRCLNLKQNKES